ncbi:MAG: hypothetical protein GVY19_09225 [Bacteroidetes bacterium]|jgi:NhaA family Na+:H+ antiporter|nr:hypothetical protein [Bacteroidota bacterium]
MLSGVKMDTQDRPGIFGGIGFTMSLFISDLAFGGLVSLLDEAKMGILPGSFIVDLCGYVVLNKTLAKEPK